MISAKGLITSCSDKRSTIIALNAGSGQGGSGGGSGGFALIACGYGPNVGFFGLSEKYAFDTDTITNGTSFAARYGPTGFGNYTHGFIESGWSGGYNYLNEKYNYNTNAITSATSFNLHTSGGAGYGNNDAGYISGGDAYYGAFSGGSLNTIKKYTYSNNVIIFCNNLQFALQYHAASGNAFLGIIAGGGTSNGINVSASSMYNYSNGVVSSSTTLGMARFGLAAAGNGLYGIFSGGSGNNTNSNTTQKYTDKYNYSSLTTQQATNLTISGFYLSASGNGNGIIFNGFYNLNYVANTNKYLFAGDIVTAGTSLSVPRSFTTSLSSIPGGF